jgi:hypothetical protein
MEKKGVGGYYQKRPQKGQNFLIADTY